MVEFYIAMQNDPDLNFPTNTEQDSLILQTKSKKRGFYNTVTITMLLLWVGGLNTVDFPKLNKSLQYYGVEKDLPYLKKPYNPDDYIETKFPYLEYLDVFSRIRTSTELHRIVIDIYGEQQEKRERKEKEKK